MSQDEPSKQPPRSGDDDEVTAIGKILDALGPLKADARSRVLSYVFSRLGMAPVQSPPAVSGQMLPPGLPPVPPRPTDIRSLRNEKKPRSSIEMAAIVAYYLSELAPDRKTEIDGEDIKKYFKQADFPLPGRAIKTLFDARNAGYLDAGASRGTYKLNPVGHNLVAHSLPATGGDARVATPRRPRGRRNVAKKKMR